MRISDWSSDVCSSDLASAGPRSAHASDLDIIGEDELSQDLQAFLQFLVLPTGEGELRDRRLVARLAARQLHEGGEIAALGMGSPAHQRPDRKSTRLNSSHSCASSMPSFACKT